MRLEIKKQSLKGGFYKNGDSIKKYKMIGNILVKVIAKNPPSILLVLGGIGLLTGISGAGILLALGFGLQLIYLAKFFI